MECAWDKGKLGKDSKNKAATLRRELVCLPVVRAVEEFLQGRTNVFHFVRVVHELVERLAAVQVVLSKDNLLQHDCLQKI